MPTRSMRLPANINRGMAIRAKEFVEVKVLCAMTMGSMPAYMNVNAAEAPIVNAMGIPRTMNRKNRIISIASIMLHRPPSPRRRAQGR